MIGLVGTSLKSGRAIGKKANHQNKSIALKLISLTVSVAIICMTVMGPLMAPLPVYAASGFQVGAVILAMLQMLGQTPSTSAITNYMASNATLSQTITSVEQIEGIGSAIDQALSADLGTARLTAQLSNSSADMTILKEQLIGAGADPEKVRLLPDSGATVGENVEAAMKEYFENGELSQAYGGKTLSETGLQAAFGMTALAYEGAKLGNFQQFQEYARAAGLSQSEIDAAVDSGAAFGDPSAFADYIKAYRKTIAYGADVNASDNTLNNIGINGYGSFMSATCYAGPTRQWICNFYFDNGIVPVWLVDNTSNNTGFIYMCNTTDSVKRMYYRDFNDSVQYDTYNIPSREWFQYGTYTFKPTGALDGTDGMSLKDFVNKLANENYVYSPGSPSISGNNGQLKGTVDPNQSSQPYVINISPVYNVNNYNINPIPSLQDYSGLVDTLEQNVADNISNEDIVGPFISPYLVPRTVIDNPVDPDPQPTGAPNPTTAPNPVPPQPTVAPKPTITPEQEEQNIESLGTVDLRDIFPFCIPFDIAAVFTHFTAEREAPHLQFTIDLGPAGSYDIDIDFSDWDDIAALLRLLQLIGFIVGLALVARKLIGDRG